MKNEPQALKPETSEERLLRQIRAMGTLEERLTDSMRRIGNMCSERRPPSMSIPVNANDDDHFICATIKDALSTMTCLCKKGPTRGTGHEPQCPCSDEHKAMNPQTQKDVAVLSDKQLNLIVRQLLGDNRPVHELLMDHTLPDYCNDLNAMHAAETWFIQNNELPVWNNYVSKLVDICAHNNPEPYYIKTVVDVYCFAHHATARQRAEAFVKIIEGSLTPRG